MTGCTGFPQLRHRRSLRCLCQYPCIAMRRSLPVVGDVVLGCTRLAASHRPSLAVARHPVGHAHGRTRRRIHQLARRRAVQSDKTGLWPLRKRVDTARNAHRRGVGRFRAGAIADRRCWCTFLLVALLAGRLVFGRNERCIIRQWCAGVWREGSLARPGLGEEGSKDVAVESSVDDRDEFIMATALLQSRDRRSNANV